jgi:uncharacterized protein
MAAPETVRCPTCRQPVRWEGNPYRPFCSKRCKLRDLGNWAAERYRIAGESPPEPEAQDADETEG